MSYCAKCFENTMKLKFSEPNNLCLKEMIPIIKCSKNRFPGYLKTVANQYINCLGAVPQGWKHCVQCYGASWDWQDVQERPFLALDQAFLFLVQRTSTLGDVLINPRGVIQETVTLLSLCCCTICYGLEWNLKLCSGIHLKRERTFDICLDLESN